MTLEPMSTERRMSNAEAVALTRYAKAACPQQAFDQYTPDAWADLLSDLRFVDAQAALKAVVQRQPFVSPAEIRDEVKRIRRNRLDMFGPMPDPPDEIGADPEGYRQWYRRAMTAICDGELTSENRPADRAALVQRIMPDFANVLASVPRPTRGAVIAETKRAKPADFGRRMDDARTELANRPAVPMPTESEPVEEQTT